jgi:pimeloyl-ACP methyl ester carboxylesterase
MKKIIAAFILFFSLSSQAQTKEQYDELLKKFRTYYNQQQYDSSYQLLAPALKNALTADAWKNTLSGQVMPAVGLVTPFVFDQMSKGFPVYIANGEKSALALQISVDNNLHLNGLHIVPAKNSAAPARPQTPVPPFSYHSEDLEYDNADRSIHFGATLTYPNSGGPFTTILLITGSGIQDRDETVFGHKPFAVLADFLTKKGYAVMRVDDRTAGKTTGSVTNATSADFEKDVEAGLNYLETRPEVNKNKLGVLGHSEGAVIAAMVASQRKDIDFIIMWAAPIVGGAMMSAQQNMSSLKKNGLDSPAVESFGTLFLEETSSFKNYNDSTGLHDNIKKIFVHWKDHQPDSILQQLNVSGDSLLGHNYFDMYEGLFQLPWMRYFMTHDFAGDLAKVKCKVLAINGSKDTQVPAEENLKLIRNILEKNGNKSFTTIELPGLNHLLQTADTGDFSEYISISETISPLALQAIGDWLDKTVGSSVHN